VLGGGNLTRAVRSLLDESANTRAPQPPIPISWSAVSGSFVDSRPTRIPSSWSTVPKVDTTAKRHEPSSQVHQNEAASSIARAKQQGTPPSAPMRMGADKARPQRSDSTGTDPERLVIGLEKYGPRAVIRLLLPTGPDRKDRQDGILPLAGTCSPSRIPGSPSLHSV
jgi:hypothetical protein